MNEEPMLWLVENAGLPQTVLNHNSLVGVGVVLKFVLRSIPLVGQSLCIRLVLFDFSFLAQVRSNESFQPTQTSAEVHVQLSLERS